MDLSKLLACCCLLLLTACESGSEPGATARLRITQHQTACCYMEGQVSFLEVSDASGTLLVDKIFRLNELIQPMFDQSVAPGTYTIRSWQQPCNGNCGSLDARSNACMEDFTLAPGDEVFVTTAFAPGPDACTLSTTQQPLPSPMPDAVALRAEYRSCGEGMPPLPAPIRQRFSLAEPPQECFSAANQNAEKAEMQTFEASPTAERTMDRVIYRTRTDRSIEVFKRLNQREPVWQHYTCTSLVANGATIFTLAECTEPAPL